MKIYMPLVFSCLGQRAKNEDFLWPDQPSADNRLFVLCDGMGGLDRGEEASRLVAQAVQHYWETQPPQTIDESYIAQTVGAAHQALAHYMTQNPFVSRMGSTLVLLFLCEKGAVLAHIGDSRAYQLRGSQILYQTKDHKQVLDMVAEGIITHDQAATHPWRNRLSRSISLTADHPRKPDEASLVMLTDVQPNDYFFMCTDGVLEQIDDEVLTAILSTDAPNEEKIKSILARCEDVTKDNYSGFLIQIAPTHWIDKLKEIF